MCHFHYVACLYDSGDILALFQLFTLVLDHYGGCSSLMVSALDSRSSGLGLSPGWGHCVVFLDKTLYYHNAFLHPGLQMGTDKCNAGGNPAMN